jgi:hypothetical protein
MCLSQVNFHLEHMPEEGGWVGRGYKALWLGKESITSHLGFTYLFRFNEWLRADEIKPIEGMKTAIIKYPRGFHCFLDKSSCFDYIGSVRENYKVFNVLYRNVLASGDQDGIGLCVVSLEVKILDEVKE